MNGETTYFIYAGAHSIIEYDASGHMLANTLYGLGVDEIISRSNHGAGQFLMQDRIGNTVAVTGSKGELLEQYRYDAFGTPEIMDENGNGRPNNESAINNRFLFTGREWISRFGFYENRARAYHPGLGRFMSEDPLGFAGGDANLFRYCGNDPVNRSDPSGLVDEETIYISDVGDESDVNQATRNAVRNMTPQITGHGTSGNVQVFFGNPTGNPGGPGRGPNAGVPGGGPGSVTGGTIGGPPGRGDVGGGGGGKPRYSGSITVDWWPTFLTFPYTTPATPEQAAWTDQGRVPTLIAAGILAAPLLAPASGAELAAGGVAAGAAIYNSVESVTLTFIGAGIVGYQGLMANPQYIMGAQQFIGGFVPGMGGGTSWYGYAGRSFGTWWRYEGRH